MTAGWLVGEAVDRNALRCRRTGPRLFGLPRPGPGLLSGERRGRLLPLHGGAPEHALVGASALLLHLEQRALAPFGVDPEL